MPRVSAIETPDVERASCGCKCEPSRFLCLERSAAVIFVARAELAYGTFCGAYRAAENRIFARSAIAGRAERGRQCNYRRGSIDDATEQRGQPIDYGVFRAWFPLGLSKPAAAAFHDLG